jgi:hypothetical protein
MCRSHRREACAPMASGPPWNGWSGAANDRRPTCGTPADDLRFEPLSPAILRAPNLNTWITLQL